MLFVACIGAINYKSVLNGKDHIQPDHPMTSSGKIDRLADKKRPEVAPNLRHRKMSNSVNTINLSSIKMTVHSSSPDAGLLFTTLLLSTIYSRALYKHLQVFSVMCSLSSYKPCTVESLYHLTTLFLICCFLLCVVFLPSSYKPCTVESHCHLTALLLICKEFIFSSI